MAELTNFLGTDSLDLGPSKYKYAYVLLDTNNIDTTLSTDTKFVWKFLNYVNLSSGTVNCVSDIRDLVGMRLFPVKMNLTSSTAEPGKTYTNNNLINMNFSFTICIEEFKAQSFIGRDGRRFHFSLFPYIMNYNKLLYIHTTPNNPYIEYTTSGKNNGWFWFQKPVTEFSTLTVTIGNPFDLIKISSNERTLIPLQLIYLGNE